MDGGGGGPEEIERQKGLNHALQPRGREGRGRGEVTRSRALLPLKNGHSLSFWKWFSPNIFTYRMYV